MLKGKADSSKFNDIKIAIASPSDIVRWARGEKNEVLKPETINYRNLKPETDGLFCERIFGPTKDWECHCGKYKKIKHKGIICERCGVEITKSKVRRERMGFLRLVTPVSHIWYLKGVPCPISMLLGNEMPPRTLEKILYYANYVVIFKNKYRIEKLTPFLNQIINIEIDALKNQTEEWIQEEREELEAEIQELKGNNEWTEDKEDSLRSSFNQTKKAYIDDCESSCGMFKSAMELLEQKNVKDEITEDEYKNIEALYYLLKNLPEENFQAAIEVVNGEGEFDFLTDKNNLQLDLLFEVGIGGSAIKELLAKLDLYKLKAQGIRLQGSNQTKETRRMEIIDSFIYSNAKPEWMMLECLPVISPELRPMVQLDGGRFATSDLNDLYRRVINRNNRHKKISDYVTPKQMINYERRLLQEAVDGVLDNSKKQRPITGSNSRKLKSLSDLLKGKEGRFRKNLLGKRVDYSGRSVIVVGPSLKIYQCGLPKEMALELFKPFVIKDMVEKGTAANIKNAKRKIEEVRPEVWDSLEDVICEHPVLLNRAPTLHRLGIQAFEPQLVEGKAIMLHPLVCPAFNADFDGDQMAIHVPLSAAAQAEARALMLSSHNLFSPATGKPIVAPSQDVVLGCFYLTVMKEDLETRYATEDVYDKDGNIIANKGASYIQHVKFEFAKDDVKDSNGNIIYKKGDQYKVETDVKEKLQLFTSPDDAIMAYYEGLIDVHQLIGVRLPINEVYDAQNNNISGKYLRIITPGRLIFNKILPDNMKYLGNAYNEDEQLVFDSSKKLILKDADAVSKKLIGKLITECHDRNGHDKTVVFLDEMKNLGYKYATIAGMSIAITDMDITSDREQIIKDTQKQVRKIEKFYSDGRLTQTERRDRVLKSWTTATEEIADSLMQGIQQFNQISIITKSGARGSTKQISQLSGMRGLMSDPQGNPIEDLPVTSNFHEGLSVLEYFVSTHGARKGLADTALRTADAGYLTRRLVDVAQDVIVREHNCGTTKGIEVTPIYENNENDKEPLETVGDRIAGRTALKTIGNPDDILSEPIYKFYEPFLFEYDTKEIVTEEKPDDYTNVTTINTGLASPVVSSKKFVEWKIDLDGKFSYILESELDEIFPKQLIREIPDEEGNICQVVDTINYTDGKIVVTDYEGNEFTVEHSLEKFDEPGSIDPRNAWVVRDDIISDLMAKKINDAWMEADRKERETGEPKKFRVWIRSPFTCESKMGICSKCYGKDLSLKIPVEVGTAVGIIAAQSIGEPGTQLTMRTFHTGGVAGKYLTGVANVKKKQQEALKEINADRKKGILKADSDKNSNKQIQSLMAVLEDPQGGLLRVAELFEARKPKGKAITADIDGIVTKIDQEGIHEVWVDTEIPVRKIDLECLTGFKFSGELFYKDGDEEIRLVGQGKPFEEYIVNDLIGKNIETIYLRKKYLVPHRGELQVSNEGEYIKRGQKITPGPLNPSEVLTINKENGDADKYAGVGGDLGVMKYIVEEIQKVYKSQGVDINDKHVEVIVRQMLRKVKIIAGRDTDLKPGTILDKSVVRSKNASLDPEKRKAIYTPVLYGITDASLNTDSFLSAASFQKTTKVLTEAAVKAKRDNLIGLKENVIIGRLIPAGTGLKRFRKVVLLDKNGKPLPTTRYNYDPLKDKTVLLENFEWKKGSKKCIEELGVKTVGQIYPKLNSLSDWGTGVEKEIQDTVRRHIAEQIKNTKMRNDALVDTDGDIPEELLIQLNVQDADKMAQDKIEIDNELGNTDSIDVEDAEEMHDAETEYASDDEENGEEVVDASEDVEE